MNTLVTYVSSTGNTMKVAEAIFGTIDGNKELKPISEVDSLDSYDLVMVGFPVVGAGAPGKVKRFLRRKAGGKKVALFVTHAMPSGMEEFAEVIPNCRAAAGKAELLGVFDCQGKIVPWLPKVLRLHPSGPVRRWAREDGERHGAGHPSDADLERARTFAALMVKATSSAKER